MKRHIALVLLAGMMGLAGPAAADETTFCNAYITSLPYTITTQGHYCFDRNLSTAITSGNAITIDVDFVVLDLNNFKLGGGSAGLATTAVGIYSNNHSNITIRNGNIRGFAFGISLDGTTAASSANNLVENNAIDGNTVIGIQVFGTGNTLRNNIITNTGGSTASPHPFQNFSFGIVTFNRAFSTVGATLDVLDTTVAKVTPRSGGNLTYGIYQYSSGGGTVDHSRVTGVGVSGSSGYSIVGNVCRDNTVQAGASGVSTYSCTLVGHNY